MSVLNENTIIGASAAGGDYEIEQSLRFNDDDTPYLSFQPSSASNRKTYTFSFWFKRATQTNESPIFTSNQGHEPGFNIMFGGHLADDYELNVYDYTSGSANIHLRTTQKFRDSSAWYHIAIAVDTTQGTAANRAKIYVNGNQVTSFATETYPSQNLDTNMNNPAQTSGKTWSIGSATERGEYTDGYLAEFNFIDGQALTPDSFGETGTYNEWKPIAYAGTYGTNGFYLPFEQDYTVEGFSTVTYEGNGATQYIGGTGFQPDLLWFKARTATNGHSLVDSVRGEAAGSLSSNDTTAEDSTDRLNIDSDGFTLTGNYGFTNTNNVNYVAWNWDMGGTTASNTSGSITSSVRANPAYGQSIVTYTGNGSDATIGTGLTQTPDLVITKRRTSATEWWIVWHSGFCDSDGDWIALNNNQAARINGEAMYDASGFTSSTFGVRGGATGVNVNGATQVSYCFHDVANYSKFGSYSGTGSSGNAITTGFAPAFVMVKRTDSAQDWQIIDNTRDPYNPATRRLEPNNSDAEVNDTSYNNCNFTSTGFTWQADGGNTNASGGTYIYAAFADTREYAYWYDQSGNNNDWTSEGGLTESDVMVDSPTNNFATWNPIDSFGTPLLSEGNLKFQLNTARCRGTIASQVDGKIYFEVYNPTLVSNTNVHHMGLASIGLDINNASNMETAAGGGAVVWTYANANGRNIYARQNGSNVAAVALPNAIAAGDIIAFASDSSTGKVWMSQNNSWLKANGSFDGSNALSDSNYLFQLATGHELAPLTMPVGNYVGILNCGQDSSFAGSITPQGNQDSNGIGDFYYAPPTGFLALCTANLPDVDVIPSENFNTVLYTGNGSTQSITTDLNPDLVWMKPRSEARNHRLVDQLRGNGVLSSNTTDAESTGGDLVLTSTGFNLTSSSNNYNGSGITYAAWNWKAGGSAVSNTNGTITSSVSANPSAGFSIVSWSGDGGSGTVGHSLSQKPQLLIQKNRTNARNWYTFTDIIDGSNDYLKLDTTDAAAATGMALPTSSVFTNDGWTSSESMISYCFHSVDGYSKVGSYTGNGSATDGTFVHCGFKPAWVMLKRTNTSGDSWFIFDNAREPENVMDYWLGANLSNAESQTTFGDFTSNGFKMRSANGAWNASGSTYIFYAVAESPFKHTNAR